MKILIIGGGSMGITYAYSFLRSRIVNTEEMMILEKSQEKAVELRKKNIGTVYGSAENCLPQADLVILAVKPQDTAVLFDSIQPLVQEDQIFLSIMAGVKIDSIAQGLGITKIIRAMPNLPAQIGLGMTVFTSSSCVERNELVQVQNLINTTGKSIYVSSEALIDSATAISGSGPAYVLYFMNAMIEAAQELGFSASESELLAWQTFFGAVDLFHKNDKSCEEWIKMVSSRGGTTEAAIKYMDEHSVHQAIIGGAKAAFDRAVELGKNTN